MQRVLITGGNGFIGSHLAAAIDGHGFEVSLFDKAYDWRTSNLEVKKTVGRVTDGEALGRAMADVDMVVHLAAVSRVEDAENDPSNCIQVNLQGTARVAKLACESSKTFVIVSSREVYGNAGETPLVEDSPKRPVSIYGVSKLAAEHAVRDLGRKDGLRYVIVRLSNVFGSLHDRPERVVPKFVRQACTGADITVHEGDQCLDFTLVDDVVRNLKELLGMADDVIGQDYNFVSGESVSILNLAKDVQCGTRSRSSIVITEKRCYGARRFFGNPSKMLNLLGDNLNIRGLHAGLPLYLERVDDAAPTIPSPSTSN